MTLAQIEKYETVILKEDWSEDLQKGAECVIVEYSPCGVLVHPVEDNSRSLPIPVRLSDVLPGKLIEQRATSSKGLLRSGEKVICIKNPYPTSVDVFKKGSIGTLVNDEKRDADTMAIETPKHGVQDIYKSCVALYIDDGTKKSKKKSTSQKQYLLMNDETPDREIGTLEEIKKEAKRFVISAHPNSEAHIYELKHVLTVSTTTTFKKVK